MHFVLAALIECANELKPRSQMQGCPQQGSSKDKRWRVWYFFLSILKLKSIICFHNWATGQEDKL